MTVLSKDAYRALKNKENREEKRDLCASLIKIDRFNLPDFSVQFLSSLRISVV
jgi:hypothetical protein